MICKTEGVCKELLVEIDQENSDFNWPFML